MINKIKTPLSQWDPRWSNTIVVTNTIGRIGCTIVSLSMLTGNSIKYSDPNEVKNTVRFTDVKHPMGANLIIWDSIVNLQGVIGFERLWTNTHEHRVKCQQAINEGHGILIECENQAHWVACMQWGGAWDCVDPRNGQARTLAFDDKSVTGYCIVRLNKPTIIEPNQLSMSEKKQLQNFYQEKDKLRESAIFSQLFQDEQNAFMSWDGNDNDAPDLQFVANRIVNTRQQLEDYKRKYEELAKQPAKVEPTADNSTKFDMDKFLVGFSKVNADKATYVASIGVILTQANEVLNLGVDNAQITVWAGALATLMVLGGVIRQSQK